MYQPASERPPHLSLPVRCSLTSLSLVFALLALTVPQTHAQTFSDPGFISETVATLPAYKPVGLAFAPDGRIFIWQKDGVVRIVKNGALLSTPFLDIQSKVNALNDRGLLGLALAPNFSTNGYVYLLYTYEEGGNPNDGRAKTARLTRVTVDPANPDVALPSSEVLILGSYSTPPCSNYAEGVDCIGSDADSHTIGTLRFAPDGKLFVSIGDGAAYTFADPLALRSQNLNSYNGKILRINPDGTAPADNPFYDGTNSIRSKVYAYGLRNPYRFALNPSTGEPYIGDVGWNDWEEQNRGRGSNFGWPCYEGNGPQPGYQAQFPQCQQLAPSAVTAPLYTYNHSEGNSTIGGTFYTGTQYPAPYRGNYFFADYGGGWIRRMVFDGSNNVSSIQPFATILGGPVSVELGPDGSLYYISFPTGQLRRLRYASAPVAAASANPASGNSPLTVSFSSNGSNDPKGAALTYRWEFGDGAVSTDPNPTHTYIASSAATFTAKLTVTDTQNVSSSATVNVTVASRPPTATILTPSDGASVNIGDTVVYRGTATDPDESLPPSALSWTILLHHNDHVHSYLGGTGTGGSFVIENHGEGTFYYEIILTATDSSGLKDTKQVKVYPLLPPSTLPTPWLSQGVGSVNIAGSAGYSAGTFTVKGSGADIWDDTDAFHFVYQPLNGDGQIVARVVSVQNTDQWAKAGVMIRESLTANARHAMMLISAASGSSFQSRDITGGFCGFISGGKLTAPYWVKLIRSGSNLSGYQSADGINWVPVGTATLSLPGSVYVGLAVTSHNVNLLCTATFDNVAVNNAAAPPSPGSGTGLKGEYFDNQDLTGLKLTRIDPTVNFDWGQGSPDPAIGPDTFSVRWTGQVQPKYSETYTFYTISDDGVRLWVNGQLLINDWTDHAATENSGTITLTAGQRYDLKMEYYDNLIDAVAKLSWSSPSQPKEIIPKSQLYPPAPGSNLPPTVSITSPSNGATLTAPATITINATAADSDGTITKVEFYQGSTLLGTDTNAPYSFTWNNVPAGNYTLIAKVTDNNGATATSNPVNVTVSSRPGLSVKINFQPDDADIPDGYLADSGEAYGKRGNGFTYGWDDDHTDDTRQRDSPNSPDQRYDTLIHMQKYGEYRWGIAVPNGTYTVHLVAGDPENYDSVYKVDVEGVLTVDGTPTSNKRWIEGTKTVTVKDGRLTVSNAKGSHYNKLCFIEITSN